MAPTHSATATTEDSPTFWACTKFNIEEVHYTWTIHNFILYEEKCIESPVFKSPNGQAWHLNIYPRGECDSVKDYVSLFVYFETSNNVSTYPQVRYQLKMSAQQQSGADVYVSRKSEWWKVERCRSGRGYPRFVKRDDLIQFLKDDPLIISCTLAISGDRIHTSGQSSNAIPEGTLSDDLGSLFKDPNAGDTIIEVDGKEFLVYKGILQARSPVFAAMFQHEMEEQIQKRVIIADFEPKVVEEMLTYIYTDTSPNLQTMAYDLLPIADKYNLERLKIMSADVLSRKLTNENAIETLILAELYGVNVLKTCAINFLTTNSSYFTGGAVWENILSSLLSKHPNLILEVTNALFASRK